MMTKDLDYFFDGLNRLADMLPGLEKLATALGQPEESESLPTAAVMLDTRSDEIKFVVNRDFIESLPVDQRASVIAHETNHVLLSHLYEALQTERWPQSQALINAHEAIINDHLLALGMELPDFVVTGAKLTGDDFSFLTTDEAYKLLARDEEDSSDEASDDTSDSADENESGEGGSASGGGGEHHGCSAHDSVVIGSDGELRPATPDELSKMNDALVESIIDALDEGIDADVLPSQDQLTAGNADVAFAADQQGDQSVSKSSIAGTTAAEELVKADPRKARWAELLTEINPLMNAGSELAPATYNWARESRLTMPLQGIQLPTLTLDSERGALVESSTPVVLIALDFSLSIPRELARTLAELARSIPGDLIEPHCVTYSTEYVDFDFRSSTSKCASGGTDFSAIERKAREIEQQSGDYPYVLNLTDGQAGFRFESPTQEQLDERWYWIDVFNRKFGRDYRRFMGNKLYSLSDLT